MNILNSILHHKAVREIIWCIIVPTNMIRTPYIVVCHIRGAASKIEWHEDMWGA